ncbi:hypothetical protein HDA40_007911 [Hamadaea flava]|uniref:Uncharacterized protein n=1 Tax=Hamadaea flava TaxID=1742688 RepID=A0ABV8LZP7_9ACTN|nr:hypothetical protein [Hamadaea flava]MCP2329404.1 hypothetical protein [Hamadaea flava]
MESLFKFAQARPAYRSDPDPIPLAAPTELQALLEAAAALPDGTAEMKRHAEAFTHTEHYVTGEQPDQVLDQLNAVAQALREEPTGDLTAVITEALGGPVASFLDSAQVTDRLRDLKDSILVIKLLPTEHGKPIDSLVQALRAYNFLVRFGSDQQQTSPSAAMRRGVVVPDWFVRPRATRQPLPTGGSIRDRLRGLADRYDGLDVAIADLLTVPSTGFQASPQVALPERLPPVGLRPAALFQAEVSIRQKVLETTVFSAGTTVSRTGTPSAGTVAYAADSLSIETLGAKLPGFRAGRGAFVALSGRPAFEPAMGLFGMRLQGTAIERLRESTRATLTGHGLDLQAPLPESVSALLQARKAVHDEAQALVRPLLERVSFRRRGSTLITRSDALLAQAVAAPPRGLIDVFDQLSPAEVGQPAVPMTHADITPVGIMDLLIVRQALKGYELGEIAHVENVLQGELRDRVVRTRTETEATFFEEREQETERTSSLETADRFEIRREAQSLLSERADVRGSMSVSGSYGPTVDFQATADGGWSRDSQESETSANTMARDVTQTATERVAERILTRQTRRTTIEVEDTDRHTFDNKDGTDHIVGVYQWLTKVYEAQVYNYGQRTLYELMVPEPGAALLEAFRRTRAEAVEIAEPPRFTLRPRDLHPDTYQQFVALYGATGVKPPPQPYVTQGYDFSTGGESEDQEFTDSTQIKVPDGYRAVQATVAVAVTVWDDWAVDVVVGRHANRFQGISKVWTTPLDDETESVPFGIVTDKVGDIAVAVEVHCTSTDRAIGLWQSEAHGQILDAYRARQSEYEAKLSTLEADAPPDIRSRSAYRNRELMVDELKRACVSVLTEQHYELFDAIDTGPDGLPQIRFAEARAEGAYVRFFEHAFEWENMSWICYPYFWGRRSTWFERLEIQDGDIEFEDFLKAGYARVVVPVRPGFAAAVDHFRLRGEPWGGGPLPTISDKTYLPIAQEIAERLDRPGQEIPVGEPWDVRVPTTLVHLRQTSGLPGWVKQPDGGWLPDDR